MSAQVTTQPTGKQIGTTTIGATGGGVVFGAVTIVLVWVLSEVGVEIPDYVAQAITVILSAVGALIAGKLSPSNQIRTETQIIPVAEGTPAEKSAAASATVFPDGTGSHRADDVLDNPDSDLANAADAHSSPIITSTTVEVEDQP